MARTNLVDDKLYERLYERWIAVVRKVDSAIRRIVIFSNCSFTAWYKPD